MEKGLSEERAKLLKSVEKYVREHLKQAKKENEQIGLPGGIPGSVFGAITEPPGQIQVLKDLLFKPRHSQEREGDEVQKLSALIEERVKAKESFYGHILRLLRDRDLDEKEIYQKAGLDRKLFSKIRCNENYHPQKETVLALAIAMELSFDETKDLLASAGRALANDSAFDLAMKFFLEKGIYDFGTIDEILQAMKLPTLLPA